MLRPARVAKNIEMNSSAGSGNVREAFVRRTPTRDPPPKQRRRIFGAHTEHQFDWAVAWHQVFHVVATSIRRAACSVQRAVTQAGVADPARPIPNVLSHLRVLPRRFAEAYC